MNTQAGIVHLMINKDTGGDTFVRCFESEFLARRAMEETGKTILSDADIDIEDAEESNEFSWGNKHFTYFDICDLKLGWTYMELE